MGAYGGATTVRHALVTRCGATWFARARKKKVPLRLHACHAEIFVRCCGRTAANLTRRRMPIDAAGGATRRKFNIFHPVSPDCAVAPQAITLAAERPRHTTSGRCSRQECCACGGGAGTPESISSQLLPLTTAAAVGPRRVHALPTRLLMSGCTRRRGLRPQRVCRTRSPSDLQPTLLCSFTPW